MKKKLLSIVIPTYNMERYLHRCLNSTLIEKRHLLEVIIVNDGSQDMSLEIAREYEYKYPETFKVIDKGNGNYGSCVNRGIDKAIGQYFRILDADDYFDKDALSELIEKIESFDHEPDLIISNYQEDYPDGYSNYIINHQYKYNNLYLFNNVVLGKQKGGYLAVMHRMTYKLEVIRASMLRHLEGISYTDSEYCFYPLRKVKTIMFLNITLYHYQLGREGQTVSELAYQKNIHNLYRIIDRMLNSFKKEEKNLPYYKSLICIIQINLKVYYKTILTGNFEHNEDLNAMDDRIKAFDKDLYEYLGSIKKYHIIPIVKLWRKGIKPNSPFFFCLYRIIGRRLKLIRK